MNLEFGTPYHHKTIDQCRVIGRIGGRRSARNRRQRRLAQPPTPTSISLEPERETAHEASLLLAARWAFIWSAPMRPTPKPSRPTVSC
jgi:hypothetical protein